MKRIFDFTVSLVIIVLASPIIIAIGLMIKITSEGPIIFKQKRVGRDNVEFKILKFRTMIVDTPSVATNDLVDSKKYLTKIGGFLRKSSLDEIPQLFNVLKGEMSLVGPRPIMAKEEKLINLRVEKHVNSILPGITGLAQIHGRDSLSVEDKVYLDEIYMHDNNRFKDIKIIFFTIFKVIKRDGIAY